MNNTLVKYSSLANKILNNETRYKTNKAIISEVFTMNNPNKVQFRLTVIDSYYSTQMSKRLYGIEDIANELVKYSDEFLKLEIAKFLQNPTEGIIKELFNKSYGFDKEAKNAKKAISLLSKYFYFLSECQFPIYDTLGKISYNLLKNNDYITSQALTDENYFELMIVLNQSSTIKDLEKLDNLLWLLGKIKEGSFSILMDKSKYETIVKQVDFSKAFKSQEKDKAIRRYIQYNFKKSNSFSPIEKEFLEFAFTLNELQ